MTLDDLAESLTSSQTEFVEAMASADRSFLNDEFAEWLDAQTDMAREAIQGERGDSPSGESSGDGEDS